MGWGAHTRMAECDGVCVCARARAHARMCFVQGVVCEPSWHPKRPSPPLLPPTLWPVDDTKCLHREESVLFPPTPSWSLVVSSLPAGTTPSAWTWRSCTGRRPRRPPPGPRPRGRVRRAGGVGGQPGACGEGVGGWVGVWAEAAAAGGSALGLQAQFNTLARHLDGSSRSPRPCPSPLMAHRCATHEPRLF